MKHDFRRVIVAQHLQNIPCIDTRYYFDYSAVSSPEDVNQHICLTSVYDKYSKGRLPPSSKYKMPLCFKLKNYGNIFACAIFSY